MLIKNLLGEKKRSSLRTLDVDAPVSAAIETFADARFRCLPILDNGALVGVLTIRDLMKHLAADGGAGISATVADAMTRDPVTVSSDETVDAAEKAFAGRFNHLPVLENGKLVALLTPADLLNERLQDVRSLASDLEHYILGR